jgi:beta-glucosidase
MRRREGARRPPQPHRPPDPGASEPIAHLAERLFDSYEWGSYTPRFGLYTVNVDKDPTLKRRPTAAVKTYRSVVRDHGVGRSYRLHTRPQASNCATTAVAPQDRAVCTAAAR